MPTDTGLSRKLSLIQARTYVAFDKISAVMFVSFVGRRVQISSNIFCCTSGFLPIWYNAKLVEYAVCNVKMKSENKIVNDLVSI